MTTDPAHTDEDIAPPGPILDGIPAAFHPLLEAAEKSTSLRTAVTTAMGHDPFRFEWGTWVDADALADLMDRIDEVRLNAGSFDRLTALAQSLEADGSDNEESNSPPPRFRVAGGQDWDAILHLLPQGTQRRHRWATGSWSIVKPLIGVVEVAMLRGPDRDGLYRKSVAKDLRGGGDGGFLGGGGSSDDKNAVATSGEDAVKYVGGPLRCYEGKSGKTVILEVVVRPPNSVDDEEMTVMPDTDNLQDYLSIVVDEPEEESASSQGDNDPDDKSVAESNEDSDGAGDESKKTASLGERLNLTFDKVGGLDDQLDAIVRRVLASRANPEAARRLGVNHVRGILLSGPPGCGKTLLARELAALLGAREPQIVNGPEILDKFIGEAEKRVRALFAPAEQEYKQVGDASALHLIILDEMDAIARKRGSMSSDTTGVRDSVVNQLLAKMDGVMEANNVLVVGLTNRPELLDPALLRPGRLEVQLQVALPDLSGRRDILRIHTRRMKEAGSVSLEAEQFIDDLEDGLSPRSENFTGAELAGLVRSAASFALARSVEADDGAEGVVTVADLVEALGEVRPALGKQDEVLKARYPMGISPCSSSMKRVQRDLDRFISPAPISDAPRIQSLLLVGAGGNGGAGATALAASAAAKASSSGASDFVRFVTALDLLADGGSSDEARAAALAERFAEARELPRSLLVLDDVDQLCAGTGPGGYSSVMLATLRALLRMPPARTLAAKAGGHSKSKSGGGKALQVLAATSRSNAACSVLNELFDETIIVPLLSEASEVERLLTDSLHDGSAKNIQAMSELIIARLNTVGCKTAIRLAERAVTTASANGGDGEKGPGIEEAQLVALGEILDDLVGDEVIAQSICEVY